MDQQTFSLLLGIAGFVLGFVSAFGKIKLFTTKAAHASGAAAARWLKRQDARAAFFVRSPSAFIGFVVRRLIWSMFALAIGLLVPTAFDLGWVVVPHWVGTAWTLVFSGTGGLIISSLTSTSGDVMRAAKRGSPPEQSCG